MPKKQNRRSKRLIFVLVLLSCILTAEFFFARLCKKGDYTLQYNYLIDNFNDYSSQNKKIDLLIIGDSSCGAGIDHDVFNRLLHIKSFSYPLPARLCLMAQYYSLRDFLKSGGKVKEVILVTTPVFHFAGTFLDEYFLEHFFGIKETLQLYKDNIIGIKNIFFQFPLNALPSYRYRYSIRRFLKDNSLFLSSATNTPTNSEENPIEKWSGKNIYQEPLVDNIEKSTPHILRRARRQGYIFSHYNRYFLNEILALTYSNKIKVFFQMGPIYDKFYNTTVGKMLFRNAFKEMARYERQYSNFKIMTHHVSTFPLKHLYNNPVHLNATGEAIFSREVATRYSKMSALKLHTIDQ